MSLNFHVGEFYKAKTCSISIFNLPAGKYKLKIIREGFPKRAVKDGNELVITEKYCLERLKASNKYQNYSKENWYYFEFFINDNDIEYIWIPESIVLKIFCR